MSLIYWVTSSLSVLHFFGSRRVCFALHLNDILYCMDVDDETQTLTCYYTHLLTCFFLFIYLLILAVLTAFQDRYSASERDVQKDEGIANVGRPTEPLLVRLS